MATIIIITMIILLTNIKLAILRTMYVGGQRDAETKVELFELGPAHTRGDLVCWVPHAKVLYHINTHYAIIDMLWYTIIYYTRLQHFT